MNDETARALNGINRRFYRERAAEFSATRDAPWPGWRRLLEHLAELGLDGALDVLDVGCGNGRFAAFLDEALAPGARGFRYCGVDASPELLAEARRRPLARGCAEFARADFVETPPAAALPRGARTLVVLFGVLHGVPGRERRRALLRACAARLAPGGVLALTAWRLDARPRLAARLRPLAPGALPPGVDPRELEPDDRLLPWRDGEALRYCHAGGEREAGALFAELGLEPLPWWCADGREGALNRYLAGRAPGARA